MQTEGTDSGDSVRMKSKEETMGFKDKQKALDTLKMLEGRDSSYQARVIRTFVSRAKKTLVYTRVKRKLANIREALKVFEDWLSDYKENNRAKDNMNYLSLETIQGFRPLAKKYGVLDDSFYLAYKKEKGDYKRMRAARSQDEEVTWDIVRNRKLKDIIAKIEKQHIPWYENDDGDFHSFPTKEHVQCILLGYSPYCTDMRKFIPLIEEKFGRLSEAEDIEAEDEKHKCTKRSHGSSSSSSSEDEEPKNKCLKKEHEAEK